MSEEDCYWMADNKCYFEHLLENDHEGLIYNIIRDVKRARDHILDEDKCPECEFPERFVEEARDPSPPEPYIIRTEQFQDLIWKLQSSPQSQEVASSSAPSGPVVSNEARRDREDYRRQIKEGD